MIVKKGEIKTTEVALVLDPDFGDRAIALAQKMPVWLVASPINVRVIDHNRSLFEEGRITKILTRIGEGPTGLFARALYAIDEHHGEVSQSIPYSTLWVYGASKQIMSSDLAAELGFRVIVATAEGFRANK